MPNLHILTPQEVAEIMKVSLKTVYRWIEAGKITASHIGPKTYRILEEDLLNFIKNTRVISTQKLDSRQEKE